MRNRLRSTSLRSQRPYTGLVLTRRYRTKRRGPGAIFQHNATPHTCHVSRTFLQQQNVHVFDWPAKSPDLSPIEHVWDVP